MSTFITQDRATASITTRKAPRATSRRLGVFAVYYCKFAIYCRDVVRSTWDASAGISEQRVFAFLAGAMMRFQFVRRMVRPDFRGVAAGALTLFLYSLAIAIHWRPGTFGHHDTAYYLDGARNLAKGAGFISAESNVEGQKLAIANWPPGFSLLMVPGLWLGLSVHESAAFVLGASYVTLILSTYALLLLVRERIVGRLHLRAVWCLR